MFEGVCVCVYGLPQLAICPGYRWFSGTGSRRPRTRYKDGPVADGDGLACSGRPLARTMHPCKAVRRLAIPVRC